MTINVLHTSDWHLGKKLFKFSRIDEQRFYLDWLTSYLCTTKIDFLIISGDIFDVPSPPHDAIELFYHFLFEVSSKTKTKTLIISGNHDSGIFLNAPGNIVQDKNIYIKGVLDKDLFRHNFYLESNYQRDYVILFTLLPFFRTSEILSLSKDWNTKVEQINHENISKVIEANLQKFIQYGPTISPPRGKKLLSKIFVTHHLFNQSIATGSEQFVSLCGLDSFPQKGLEAYDYIALGHIHKAQILSPKNPMIVYPGSPLGFRFKETHLKKMSLLKITDQGDIEQEWVEVPQLFKMKSIRVNNNNYKNILSSLINEKCPILLEVIIELDSPETELAEKIRLLTQNSHLKILSIYNHIEKEEINDREDVQLEEFPSLKQMFCKYHKSKYGTEISKELKSDFDFLLNLKNQENPEDFFEDFK